MSSSETTVQAKRFIVRGRVQGVGFRWFVEREAHLLGIAGWVRNNHDGSLLAFIPACAKVRARLASKPLKSPMQPLPSA
jgi:acylphosphatase